MSTTTFVHMEGAKETRFNVSKGDRMGGTEYVTISIDHIEGEGIGSHLDNIVIFCTPAQLKDLAARLAVEVVTP